MPLMIGFSEQRLRILQSELDSIVERLPGLGVIKAILLNSLYPGVVEKDTSLKLVMIMIIIRVLLKIEIFLLIRKILTKFVI